MDNNAIPTSGEILTKTFKRLEPKVVRDQTEPRDLNYYRLAESEGWKQLKEDILGMTGNLDDVVKLENAQSIAEFGFMVLARDLTKTYLNQVISLVETSSDFVKKLQEEEESGGKRN